MSRQCLTVAALTLAVMLAACRGAETPMVTHWYGTGSYTVGVYDDPTWYQAPGGHM